MSRSTLSLAGATALLVLMSTTGAAQKAHGGGSAHMPVRAPMPHPDRPAKMDHESAAGAAHEAAKADKSHDKELEREAKVEDRTEHVAMRDARNQSTYLLKGLRLTAAERRQVREIDRKYDAQLRGLKKDEKAADKSGAPDNDAAYEQRIASLAAQERADIRAALPASQQARYDANVLARRSVKH